MSDDDPTGWFRPERRSPSDEPSGEGAAAGSGDAHDGPDAREDGLDSLFGSPGDEDAEGIDDPADPSPGPDAAARAAAGDVPTQAWSTTSDGDPLNWLGDGGAAGDEPATQVYRPGTQPPAPPAPPTPAAPPAAAAPTEVFGATPVAAAGGAAASDAYTRSFDGLDGLPPAQDYGPDDTDGEGGGPNRGVIALIIVGAILLIGLVILLVVFFAGGGPAAKRSAAPTESDSPSSSPSASASRTPSVSPTPSESPSPTASSPAPTPSTKPSSAPPAPAAPSIEPGSFKPTTAPMCDLTTPTTTFGLQWSTANATKVVISGPGGYSQGVAQSGNQDGVPFTCNAGAQSYTLTATNSAGQSVQQSIQVSSSDDE